MTGPAPFDLLGPLPTGTLVLEASAGTGKTYAIAGLVTRLVAEGHVRIDQILAVTFGRAASRELRTRIRDRLLATRDAMPDQPAAAAADDALVAFLAGCAPSEFTVRRDRLDDALSRFDTAGVATIHEFAAHTLHQLGISADTSPSERHEADTSVLVEQVIADTYAARYAADPAPVLSPGCAVTIGRAVAADPLAGLDLPVVANPEATARQEFAVAVRAALGRRKLLAGVLDFDDLITRVRDAVTGPAAEAAVAMLRDRYRVVLVDEFQDTDAAQWDILAAAFHGHATLVLIGDPKQAIYGFRGGDIHAYLAAVARADQVATLATNYRSDAGVVAGITDLFGPTELGDPQIVVRDVRAHHQQPRLRGAGPAVRLREVPIPTVTGALTPEKVGVLRDRVAADVAADIASLLTAGPTVQQPDGRWRPVTPGDIAVLVRDGKGAAAVLPALERHGLPAIHRGGASVFTSRAAGDWLTLLRAVEQPGRPTLVREVGLTPFFGHAAADLAGGGEAVLDDVARVLRRWAGVWRDTGLPAMLSMILRDSQVVPGLLGRDEGERDLTDARHIAEALQQAARDRDLGPGGLLRWLDGQIATAARTGDAEQERRLASDARAITVQTLHVSKGLQFPIVYVPFGWDRYLHDIDVARFHDATGRRLRDARGRSAGPAWNDSTAGQRAEEGGEELRLLYVGLTRARHQVVLHWAGTSNSKAAPVHRLLCARAAGQASPAATYPADPPLADADPRPDQGQHRNGARHHAHQRVDPTRRAARRPRGRAVRPGPGHRVAAHLVHRADVRGPRPAGPGPQGRRTRPGLRPERPAAGHPLGSLGPRRDRVGAGGGVPDDRPARRDPVRHPGPRGLRDAGHLCPGPGRRTVGPGRRCAADHPHPRDRHRRPGHRPAALAEHAAGAVGRRGDSCRHLPGRPAARARVRDAAVGRHRPAGRPHPG